MHYDPTTGQYIDANGDPVPEETVLAALALVVGDTRDRLLVLGTRRADGLAADSWQAAVLDELTAGHVAAAALAAGGLDRLTPPLQDLVGARLADQATFLAAFAQDVPPAAFDAGAMARLAMYAGAAWGAYQAVARVGARGRGMRLERNVMDSAARHCGDCPAESERGWVAVGLLSEPGSRTCLSQCRCRLEYKAAPVGVGA